MNKYLRSAADRFDKIKNDNNFLINPMSTQDAEIFVEIGQILKKCKLNDVLAILSEYKSISDAEIRDNLLQWNIDHPAVTSNLKDQVSEVIGETLNRRVPWIQIKGAALPVNELFGFRLIERLEGDNYYYIIVINPTPEHVKNIPMYANEEFIYHSEENRNSVIEKLKLFLEDNGHDFVKMDCDE